AEYIAARDRLLAGNLSRPRLEGALRQSGAEREAELDAIAGDQPALRERLTELAAAHDAVVAAREPYQALQQALREAGEDEARRGELQPRLVAAARAVYEAQQKYDALLEDVLASSVSPAALQRVLDQSPTSDRASEP